jgi:hypothetical protein
MLKTCFDASSKATSGNAPAGTSNPLGPEAGCHFNKNRKPGQRDFGFYGNMTKLMSLSRNILFPSNKSLGCCIINFSTL